jgi:hypothetical protein
MPTATDRRVEVSSQFRHFVSLAKRGKHKGASTYERHAHKLASALLDAVPGLDGGATSGLVEFIGLISGDNYAKLCELVGKQD